MKYTAYRDPISGEAEVYDYDDEDIWIVLFRDPRYAMLENPSGYIPLPANWQFLVLLPC